MNDYDRKKKSLEILAKASEDGLISLKEWNAAIIKSTRGEPLDPAIISLEILTKVYFYAHLYPLK